MFFRPLLQAYVLFKDILNFEFIFKKTKTNVQNRMQIIKEFISNRTVLISILVVLVIGSGWTSCTVQKSPVTGTKRAYGYTWEEEIRIGSEADNSIQQQYGIYPDTTVTNYVKRVGRKVLKESHMRRSSTLEKYRQTEFTFRVLDSPVVNAFALPGGYIYVTRGLLAHLNNEAQLAVVLGHEIGHVAARHASQRAFEQKAGQIALVGGAVVGQEVFGLPGQDLLQVGSSATKLLFLKYGRDDERESDRLGVEYAVMAGYEASEGAEFFTSLRRLSDKSGQSLPSLLSTHPDPGDREQKIPQLADQWRAKGYEMNKVERASYFDMLDGIIYSDNPREGFVRDEIFYHPDLAFRFPVPSDWQLYNQRASVILAAPEQKAVVQFTIESDSDSPKMAVEKFLAQEGITVESQQPASRDDLSAYQAIARAETREGPLKLYIYAIEHEGNVYRYLGYSDLSSFDQYVGSMRKAAEGFQRLTDESILAINPVRLHTLASDRTAIFRELIPKSLPMDLEADHLAIVNQLHMDTRVGKGTLIKIPRQ